MEAIKRNQTVIIGVVAALIVGLLGGYGWGRQSAGVGNMGMSTEQSATTTAATSASVQLLGSNEKGAASTVVAEGNSVIIANQAAGIKVSIDSVTLSQPGWVAIRNSSGVTLGAALFPAGAHTYVSVPLLEPTEAGETYQALIYFDDGTKTFNLKTETIVLNSDGSVAGTTFIAQ